MVSSFNLALTFNGHILSLLIVYFSIITLNKGNVGTNHLNNRLLFVCNRKVIYYYYITLPSITITITITFGNFQSITITGKSGYYILQLHITITPSLGLDPTYLTIIIAPLSTHHPPPWSHLAVGPHTHTTYGFPITFGALSWSIMSRICMTIGTLHGQTMIEPLMQIKHGPGLYLQIQANSCQHDDQGLSQLGADTDGVIQCYSGRCSIHDMTCMCVCVCMYVCMRVCMYVCMYVGMYVCMCACM